MIQLELDNRPGRIWDLTVSVDSKGQAQLGTIGNKEYIAQKTKQLLLTGKGEIFIDTEYGTPWFQEILGKGVDLANIRSILLDVLDSNQTLKDLGVTATDIQKMELDPSSRHLLIKDLTLTGTDPGETTTLKGLTI